MNWRYPLASLGFILATAAFPNRPAESLPACAVAPPLNKGVAIADESAIIIWDAASKTQHFIRRASFQTDVKDFGFLVPTPTKPTLDEASDEAFKELVTITAPKIVTQSRPVSSPGCGCGASRVQMMAPGNAVQVLEEKRVAGFDAAVLEAESADALSKWLLDHGYDFSAPLKSWVDVYVKKKWKITAFKVAKDAEKPSIATSAVRMTFVTEEPFFPYREPASEATGMQPSRLLRIYFLSDSRFTGNIGAGTTYWPSSVAWSNKIEPESREKLLGMLKLPKATPPESWWLTEFEDRSSPRPGTDDLIFAKSNDQGPIERPPLIRYVRSDLPGCVMCCALAVYLLVPGLVRLARRR